MKKIILLISISAVCLSCYAQQFRYGAHVSPAIGWWRIEGDLYQSVGTKFGVQAGAIIDLTLGSSERFALTSGLNWNMAPGGFEEANPNTNNNAVKEWNFGVHSLDVPITVRLRSDQLNKSVLYVQYGITLGFTLASSITNEGGKQAGTGFDYESMNPSLTMGAGIEQSLSEDKALIIGIFFQNGIRNVVIDNANDDNMFPQQVGLKAGILL